MRIRLIALPLLALSLIWLPVVMAGPTPAWAGDWRWQDPQHTTPDHFLRLQGTQGQPRGEYAGNEIAEGIVYFKMAVSQLKISPQQDIRFEIGPHGLTRTPLDLRAQNLPVNSPKAGASAVRFRFEGKLNGRILTLRCQADDKESCPAATMRFEKLR